MPKHMPTQSLYCDRLAHHAGLSMTIPIKKTMIFLFAFILFNSAIVHADSKPSGFWTLENVNDQMPYGGLTFDRTGQFTLMLYDDNCQLHTVEGGIKQKTNNKWELKSAVDYSNVFTMTIAENKLQLVDTEGVHLLFSETSKQALRSGIKKHSCQVQKQPPGPKFKNKADK